MHFILALLLSFPAQAGAAALVPGDRAAEFELESLSGSNVSLSSMLNEGKPIVLSFFGTWCNICLKEIKELPESAVKNGASVYLVGLDGDREKLARFVEKNGIKFPVLWDPRAKTTGRRYDVLRGALLLVPKTLVVSPAGELLYAADSYDDGKRAELAALLARVKDKKWEKPAELSVFFTGSINGRLRQSYPARGAGGSVAKLLTLLKQQTGKYPNRLLLDAGDFLPYNVSAPQAALVFKALTLAGYDAAALGDQELCFNGALPADLPLLGSNIGGKKGRLADKTLALAGIKVRVLSFIGGGAFSLYPEEFVSGLQLKELSEVLKGGKKADLLVLLSHAGREENKLLAARFPELDVVIGGHSQEAAGRAERAGNAVVVQASGNLESLGRLVLRFNGGKRFSVDEAVKDFEAIPVADGLPDDPRLAALMGEAGAAKTK